MPNSLTPEEITALTGEDTEDVRDEEHPKGSLDEDMEGSGVDEPNLESAAWDNEIKNEDRDNENFKAVKNFENLTEDDRELYLKMVNLRQAVREGIMNAGMKKEINELREALAVASQNVDHGSDRFYFLAMINNRMFEVLNPRKK